MPSLVHQVAELQAGSVKSNEALLLLLPDKTNVPTLNPSPLQVVNGVVVEILI